MILKNVAAVIAGVVVAPVWHAPASPMTRTPDSAGGRYIFNKQADGFVRLDTQTGAGRAVQPAAPSAGPARRRRRIAPCSRTRSRGCAARMPR